MVANHFEPVANGTHLCSGEHLRQTAESASVLTWSAVFLKSILITYFKQRAYTALS